MLISSYYPHSLNVLSPFLLSLDNKRREERKRKEGGSGGEKAEGKVGEGPERE